MATCGLIWKCIAKWLRAAILLIADLLPGSKIKEWGLQARLGELSLCDIFTTGRPIEDADRYYSS